MASEPSPLEDFVRQLRAIADGRKLMIQALNTDYLSAAPWRVFVDDVEMMLHENVVIGLRTPWVRRVAIPIYKAHCALNAPVGKPKQRAAAAIEILQQCTDVDLRAAFSQWIVDTYAKGK